MSYFYRMITGLLITCLFITACTPVSPPSPTSLPKIQPSATPLPPTKTPFPTDTAIPLPPTPTLTPSPLLPAATSTPTRHVPTLTLVPGPELITYLPPVKDVVDKCMTFEYNQTINSASLLCVLAGVGSLAISVTPKDKPVVLQDIQTLAGYEPMPAPMVGQGSQAFKIG